MHFTCLLLCGILFKAVVGYSENEEFQFSLLYLCKDIEQNLEVWLFLYVEKWRFNSVPLLVENVHTSINVV